VLITSDSEGPKWEKAEMPQPDVRVKTGWVNYNSPDVKSTFVEGGTKPAYTPLEAAKFTYETGMTPPSGAPKSYVQNPPAVGAPVQPGMPAQQAPAAPAQTTAAPMANRAAAPMSNQTGNQAITATGNAVPVSAMNRPGMSPKAQQEANKDVYVAAEKQRQEDLRALPGAMEQANTAIKTINKMIDHSLLLWLHIFKSIIYIINSDLVFVYLFHVYFLLVKLLRFQMELNRNQHSSHL